MIATLIFYSGKLIVKNEIDVNNFFSFLAAMMLAYQPVRTLSSLNIVVNQGLSAAARILPIIDTENCELFCSILYITISYFMVFKLCECGFLE